MTDFFKTFRGVFWVVLLGWIGSSGAAWGRVWTNDQGKMVEADYVSNDGERVVLKVKDREVTYELRLLSAADRVYVEQLKQSAAVPVAASAVVRTGAISGHPISKPAFPDTKGYLQSRNAKAVYKAFATGNFPKDWKSNRGEAEKEFAYEAGTAKMNVYVPPSYDGKTPLGVYLHVDSGKGGVASGPYEPLMDRMRMIYVSPAGTSNDEPMLRRVKVAVDALATVREGWVTDPKRICIGGVSGGGHMSMLIHAMFPEMFQGSISHAAQSYLPEGASSGHFPGLEEGDLKSGDFKGHKWCVISGEKDYNYKEILKTSKLWEQRRLDYRFFDTPGMGHTNAPSESLEAALKWIGM
jgi:predicted esterase